jgi:8-oxo-dGTP pyrophosphatase MutT (NUDIX family)
MKVVDKAVVAATRSRNGTTQLLVFDHPHAGTQIVKGTVEPGEKLQAAVVREMEEESGIVLVSAGHLIGVWDRTVGGGPNEDGPIEVNRWHVFHCQIPADCDSTWNHIAKGSPVEEGVVFSFRWLEATDALPSLLHPLFGPVATMIATHVATGCDEAGR